MPHRLAIAQCSDAGVVASQPLIVLGALDKCLETQTEIVIG